MLSWFRSRWLGAVLGAAILSLSTTAVVFAGSGSLNPWLNNHAGWESSVWYDNNLTATSTVVNFTHTCDDNYGGTTDAQEWAKLGLWRYAGIFPWEDRGQYQHTCGNVNFQTWNFGVQPSPSEYYKWSLVTFSGPPNELDVDSNGVNWSW
jgi:hypothetical protein